MRDHFINLDGAKSPVDRPSQHAKGMACKEYLPAIRFDGLSVLLDHSHFVRLPESHNPSHDHEIVASEHLGSLEPRVAGVRRDHYISHAQGLRSLPGEFKCLQGVL